MYKLIVIVLLMISSVAHCAGMAIEPIDLPTPNSNPIPSLNKIKNPDTVLTEMAQKNIRNNPALKDQPVSAASHNGIITLQGSVLNKDQELEAINSVKDLKGVKRVRSQLTIGDHG